MNIKNLFLILGKLKEPLFYISLAFATSVLIFAPVNQFTDILSILAGLILLVIAGEKLVENSIHIGAKLGLNSLLIGILIIGLGTSAPEIITVAIAGFQNATDLALGNIFGSNIANIGLILGAGLLMLKNPIPTHDKWKDYASLSLATIIMVGIVLFYGKVDWIISIALLTGLIAYLYYTIKSNSSTKENSFIENTNPWIPTVFGVLIGLTGLLIGANGLVNGAVNIATAIGMPQKVIGLTIIAIGTSLPELASAYASAKKGDGEMILGNVMGSNVFNLLAATSAGGFFAVLPTNNVQVDVIIMAIFTAGILLLMFKAMKAKILGLVLIASYIGFLAFTGLSIYSN